MTSQPLIEAYKATYQPIVDRFCEGIDLNIPTLDKISSPFIPLYGRDYEKSATRLMFIGIDTYGWQNGVKDFVEAHRKNPQAWMEALKWFQESIPFTNWGPRRSTFWGFIMGFIADVYGVENWGILKRGLREDLLTSVAWGNVNAIENFGSTAQDKEAELETWKKCRESSRSFWGVLPVIQGLRPDIIVVLNKQMNPVEYFSGVEWEVVCEENGCRRYRLPIHRIDVLHVPHPNNMRWSGGESIYRSILVKWLKDLGYILSPNSFFLGGIESPFAQSLIKGIPSNCKVNKFLGIEWISHELSKSNCVMSVQTLADILNAIGYKTNYGTSYEGGRGTYRLIMSAYKRLEGQGKQSEATTVARSFVRPNGHYAYEAEPHISIKAKLA